MVIEKYKEQMTRMIQMIYPVSKEELEPVLDYSISKRYREYNSSLNNTYTHKQGNQTLLALADYIMSREPIVTSYGTMFKKHSEVKNPCSIVVDQFLEARGIHKKQMFQFPKGSEEFEKYNLLQALDKIDVNGWYGCIGMYTSLVYNVNVATSVTSEGRSAVSSMMCCFESFLANSIKFGSIDEVLVFIDNVKNERRERKYKDTFILDRDIDAVECLYKIAWSCGYRWIPNDEELEIIFRALNNLGQEDLNRVYYKNNLYEFLSNSYVKNLIVTMVKTLEAPYMVSTKVPKEIKEYMDEFTGLLFEYVYYGYMIIDRIDRAENAIKNVCIISDTDSTIISLDAWFRFVNDMVKYEDLKIKRYRPYELLDFLEQDEFGDFKDTTLLQPFTFDDPEYDYDFENDELIEMKHVINPLEIYPEDNVRHSIINIMACVLDKIVNDYMIRLTKASHSYSPNRDCRLYAKTEFLFRRVLLTEAKKNYATIQELQEGNIVPEDEQLDVKGMAAMAKSSTAVSTRKQLKRIMLEDILNTPVVDQFKVIKDIAVLEKKITDSVLNGSKEYYKPVTIKSQSNYADPMRIQGIKSSYAWNAIKPDDLPAINLEERNAVDIAKTILTLKNVDELLSNYPEVKDRAIKLMKDPLFKGKIDAIAIPLDTKVPEWLLDIVDYKTIINNNISGFPFESIGIQRLHKNTVNYTNILQL